MKTYTAPTLVMIGCVVTLTQGPNFGNTDANGVSEVMAPGSVGFGL
jgi:hypothetical protein